MKKNMILATVGACLALGAHAYSDGETIAYFPFDTDYASIVNAGKNPATFPTFGTVAITTGGTMGEFVRNGHAYRANTGFLETTDGRLALDLTAFGIDENINKMTFEFFAKMTEGDVGAWAQQIMFGIAGETPSGTMGLSSAQPYYLDLERDGDHFYGKVQTKKPDGSFNTSYLTDANGFKYDGEWHHVAYVFHPVADGQEWNFDYYVDYKRIQQGWSGRGNLWKAITPGSGERLWLLLGKEQKSVHCRFDEFRITCGALDSSKFLRHVTDVAAPADGETLLHLKFDGSATSEVHNVDWAPAVLSGTMSYSTDVWSGFVLSYEGDSQVLLNNDSCFASTSAKHVQIDCPYWALQSGNLRSATLEFFVKGAGNEVDWASTISIDGGTSGFPFLVQVVKGTPNRFYLRADACDPVEGKVQTGNYKSCNLYVPEERGNASDGRWHHVALVVSERSGGDSEIRFYFDYKQVGSAFWTETFAWRGFHENDVLRLTRTGGGSFDEFRVTKGVLPVSMFLKPKNGMVLIFR